MISVWLFMGPPGSGKGTQAKRLKQTEGFEHLSTGDLLREEIQAKTELGMQIKSIVEKGQLVPDAMMLTLLEKSLKGLVGFKRVILDGFPRTLNQGKALLEIAKRGDFVIRGVVWFQVSEQVLIQRAEKRRICEQCGAIYNLDFKPSVREGICDLCGGKLVQRKDDTREVVAERILTYHLQTSPLLEFMRSKVKVISINGEQNEGHIFASLLKDLKNE